MTDLVVVVVPPVVDGIGTHVCQVYVGGVARDQSLQLRSREHAHPRLLDHTLEASVERQRLLFDLCVHLHKQSTTFYRSHQVQYSHRRENTMNTFGCKSDTIECYRDIVSRKLFDFKKQTVCSAYTPRKLTNTISIWKTWKFEKKTAK